MLSQFIIGEQVIVSVCVGWKSRAIKHRWREVFVTEI